MPRLQGMGLDGDPAAFPALCGCPAGCEEADQVFWSAMGLGEVLFCSAVPITGVCRSGTAPKLTAHARQGCFLFTCLIPILKCE